MDALGGLTGTADSATMARHLAIAAASCGLIAALAVPASAGAVESRQVDKMTAVYCKAQKKKLGKKAFSKRYGKSKPMKSCIKKQRKAIEAAYRSADEQCQAELSEFGEVEFLEEWESYDECVEWYADEYLFPTTPGEDPLEDEEEEF